MQYMCVSCFLMKLAIPIKVLFQCLCVLGKAVTRVYTHIHKSVSLRKSLSWFLERLLSKKDTLVSNDLCQRIHDSLQTLEKALDHYRSVTVNDKE